MENNIVNDRYILSNQIGHGGFATVFLACDKITSKIVAIKFLKCDIKDPKNAKTVKMFQQEAMTMAAIQQKNVVKVFDFGTYDDNPYLVMDYVKGVSLRDKIHKNGYLLLPEVYNYMIQILDGLEACHKSNIVHRDIKPQNIVIKPDGTVVLLDFGTAFISDDDHNLYEEDGSALALTVQYMAPDFKSQPSGSFQTDIYALGIMMFEMFAGRCPFTSKDEDYKRKIIQMQMTQPLPSIRKVNNSVPESFEAIIYKCCEKDPKNRYKNVNELRIDLINAYDNVIHPKEEKKPSFFQKLFGKKK